jgi:hypothetical protein
LRDSGVQKVRTVEKDAPKRKIRRTRHPDREHANQLVIPGLQDAEAAFNAATAIMRDLPQADNQQGAVERMLRANGIFRNLPWLPPFDRTKHRLHLGDARELGWIPDESVHLIVTSPPYWTLKEYEENDAQLRLWWIARERYG